MTSKIDIKIVKTKLKWYYVAIQRALGDVRKGADTTVPLHLRNTPTTLMESEGYGKEYKYPHDFEGHFVEARYLAEKTEERAYYEPSAIGREQAIKQRLETLRPDRYS